jgi:hypothetical protein
MENENQTSEETLNEESLDEETSEETVEKDTQEETSTEETSKTKEPDYLSKYKASQTEAIRLKKELDALKKQPKGEVDVDALLEIQEAVKGLDSTEVAELKTRSKALGVSLGEARQDKNFNLWKDAYKQEVEREKQTLEPTNKQGQMEREKPLNDMTLDEKNDWLVKRGFIKGFPKPKVL